MACSQPSRSRPGQECCESIDSGEAAAGWRAGSWGAGMGLKAEAGTGARTGSRCESPLLQCHHCAVMSQWPGPRSPTTSGRLDRATSGMDLKQALP